MNWKLHAAIALYVVSFMLPVIEIEEAGANVLIYGWEASLAILELSGDFRSGNWFDNEALLLVQYVWFNLANPCILLVIILSYAGGKHKKLMWVLGTIGLLSAVSWIPYIFSMIMFYFSYGYFAWIVSILMIYFYANDSSFVKPSKRKT
ncbi:MAG: hypothetical protein WDZ35_16200 [Crocinitomicaceae bacterium]